MINITEKDKFFGITYVGISRVKAICDLLIDDFNQDRFEISTAVLEKLELPREIIKRRKKTLLDIQ
jgi:hypothetical protein